MHFHLHPRFTLLTYHHPSSFERVEALYLYLFLFLLLYFLLRSASVMFDRSNSLYVACTFCFESDANATRGFEPAKSPYFLSTKPFDDFLNMSSRRNANESDEDETSSASPSPSSSPSAAAALEGMAEAIEKGAHLPSVDERIKHALECPCVKPLRDTSCREEFDLALTCFMKADEETRASDCADRFVALHQCMVKHSEEFKEFAEELVKHKNVEGPAQV